MAQPLVLIPALAQGWDGARLFWKNPSILPVYLYLLKWRSPSLGVSSHGSSHAEVSPPLAPPEVAQGPAAANVTPLNMAAFLFTEVNSNRSLFVSSSF